MNLLENLTMLLRTWRQFAFYFNKSLEKGSVKNILFFKKKLLTVNPVNTDTLGDMPWCPYHADGHIKWALRKNVPKTSCIDVKTMADKEEEG